MSTIFISHSTKDHADTEAMATWLKQQGHTSYFIDYDEQSGIRAGTDWAQVLYQRLRQCQVVVALITPSSLESKWCFGEMVMARENGKPIFPIKLKPCELPGLLSDLQSIDLTVDKESGYRRLAAGLKQQGLDPADVFDLDPARPPYPGFPAFEESDAAVFFGRSAEILSARETFEGLRRHSRDVPRLVLVLGSSGSGKSSLVRAGLIPRLKKDEKNWLPLRPFRPQDELSPLNALGFAIADTYKDLRLPCDSDLLRSRLHSAAESTPVDSGELLKIARELASAANRREATVLVTVDQAEDLLNSGSREPGKTFLQFLGASLSAGDRHLMAVATLRSDSFGVFQNQVASLDSAYRLGLEHRPLTVEPIPIERYADLIEGPARLTGLDLEDRLVLKLLQDAGQPDSLPLLAFTLRRLYDLRFEGPQTNPYAKLTLREYEELGGLAGAVQNAAERIFRERQRVTDEINAFREALIPGLIRYNEDRSYSRRRAFRHELPAGASTLLDGFVDARILVASADKDGHATVEIAHEALLRTWPTLITWLVEDRDKLRQYNTIVRAAKEWDESGRKSDLLVHRDGRLKDATELISERRFAFPLGSVQRVYLGTCEENQSAREAAAQEVRERQLKDAERLARAEAERAEEAEKRAKEQKEAANMLRRRAVVAAGAAVAALILLAVAIVMWRAAQQQARIADEQRVKAEQQTRAAEEQARIAKVQRLAAQSPALVGQYPQRSLLLAVEAIRAGESMDGTPVAVARQSLREALSLVGGLPIAHSDKSINAVTISPDNHWLVTGSADNTARLWDLTAKDPSANPVVLRGHENSVDAVAISPDNHWLVTGSWDLTARLWDLTAQDPAAGPVVLRGHEGAVYSVGISPDNHWLVTGSLDKTARLWDLTAKDPSANPVVLRGHEGGVTAVAISPDNHWVVTGSEDSTARLWDLTAKDPSANPVVLRGHEYRYPVRAVAISPDNHWVVTGSEDSTARLWDLTAKDPSANPVVLRGHEDRITAVAISQDSHWLVTGSWDCTARLWDLTAKDPSSNLVVLRGHKDGVPAVAISPNNHWLVTGSWDSMARLWDLTAKDPSANPVVLRGHKEGIDAVAISPDNHWLVTGSRDRTVRLWDLRAKQARPPLLRRDPSANSVVLRGHEGLVYAVTISPDNHWLVTGSSTVRLWDLTTKDPSANPIVLRGHEKADTALAVSPDSHWLVTGSEDSTARLWDLTAKDPSANPVVLRGHQGAVYRVAISNHWLVTSSEDSTARLWDLTAKDPSANPAVLRGHQVGISAVAISADNHWLVTGSADKTARLWDLTAKDPSANPVVLRGHENGIGVVAISPDNHWLVTGSADKTARLWDLTTKDPSANPVVFRGHQSEVQAVAISPDNHWLVTGSRDRTARLWLLQVSDLIDLACIVVGRNLTTDEWKYYFPGEAYHKTFPNLPGP